jgi:hypothetical protein
LHNAGGKIPPPSFFIPVVIQTADRCNGLPQQTKFFFTMATSFLDYYKMILDKVSFDHNLFMKEYQKATRNLHTDEIGDLNSWLRSKGFHAILSGNTQNTNNSVRV